MQISDRSHFQTLYIIEGIEIINDKRNNSKQSNKGLIPKNIQATPATQFQKNK